MRIFAKAPAVGLCISIVVTCLLVFPPQTDGEPKSRTVRENTENRGQLTHVLTVSVQPSSIYELFVPIMKRVSKDPASRKLGVFNKRDMWYKVRVFERHRGHPWREMLSPEPLVLKPTPEGEIAQTFELADGKEIKFEVSNDFNDRRLLALWSADFVSRALVGKRMSWDDPKAAVEAVAFFTTFMSPNLQKLGLGVGLGGDIVVGDPKRSIQRIAKAVLNSQAMRGGLAKVLAAGGLSVTAAHLASLAGIVVVNAGINAPAWLTLFRNVNREPRIEEVVFHASRQLALAGDLEGDVSASSRQLYEQVGAKWIYKLTFYDERHRRLSRGQLIAVNDGPVVFGGTEAIQFSRRVELRPSISGWEGYYRDPL
ncbi:MAG: hypothetical protein ACE5JO_11370, partial [Candidatus Binatia bacterium]